MQEEISDHAIIGASSNETKDTEVQDSQFTTTRLKIYNNNINNNNNTHAHIYFFVTYEGKVFLF